MKTLFVALFALLTMTASSVAFQAPELVTIKAGDFIYGSDETQRQYGYYLDEKAYGHAVTRRQGWYDSEEAVQKINLPGFEITKTAITNSQYAVFLSETKNRRPWVGADTWKSYRLAHPYSRAKRHNWSARTAPKGRENHPVVLVSYKDVLAYAEWLSKKTGDKWRLPTDKEWEKAVRGTDGRYFPWGNKFDASLLNSHDAGPFDTVRVGSFPKGASPYGLLDGAGQVFEWTSTAIGNKHHMVKGGSWDDKGCGVCRAAARHPRPNQIKHILVGFRLVREMH